MRRQWQTIAFGTLLSCAVCAGAFAQDAAPAAARTKGPPRDNTGEQAQAVAPAVVADAPNARLAALIRRDLTLIRNKGVQRVTRPQIGVYCIKPTAASGVNPATAIVTLTPEYFYSLYNEIKVQWATKGSPCPTNTIAVYTTADGNLDAEYTFSNAVSFSIIVP